MLHTLHISDYALISRLDIKFHSGLNIITGETGAGKSIMLGALSLLFGARADSRAVGGESGKSIVEATFIHPAQALEKIFTDNGIDWNPEECILRREVSANGRSRAFINDTPVPLSLLKQVAVHLVDIHSQHQNQLLAMPEFQLAVIDALADNRALLDEFAGRYAVLRKAVKNLKSLKTQLKSSADNADFIRFQLERLDSVAPQAGEEDELRNRYEELSEQIEAKTHSSEAARILSSGSDTSVTSLLEDARAHVDALLPLLPPDADIASRLERLSVELSDIAYTVERLDDRLGGNPSELKAIEQRLKAIEQLKKQHKVDSAAELEQLRDTLHLRLENLADAPALIAEAEKEARNALISTRELADRISANRHKAAEEFATELKELAAPLGMKNLRVEARVEKTDISPNGTDKVDFLFAFNKNQELTEVARSASGGEISRLMLCIKAIIARRMELPTILFDEIDTGVSGEVAAKIGRMMQQMSENIQTITITHLPQVAARGAHHYKVFKHDDDLATHTSIRELTPEQRVDELAVMLGGDRPTEASRRNARELLEMN